jgi:hypothetical protein
MPHVCTLPEDCPDQRQAAVRDPVSTVRALCPRRGTNEACNLRLHIPEQITCLLYLKQASIYPVRDNVQVASAVNSCDSNDESMRRFIQVIYSYGCVIC